MRQLLRKQRSRICDLPGLERSSILFFLYGGGMVRMTSLPCIKKCSTMGLSERTGKNVSAPTMTIVPTNNPTNSGPCVGNVPAVTGIFFLAARLPATASIGMIIRNRPISIASPMVRLYQGVLALIPAKALPLFANAARVGVQNFRQAVGAAVVQVAGGRTIGAVPITILCELQDGARAGKEQNGGRSRNECQHRHLDFFPFDLLAQILWRPADHQSGDEHRQNGEEQHPVHARPRPAEDHLADLDIEQRHQAADWREAVVHANHRAATCGGSNRGE